MPLLQEETLEYLIQNRNPHKAATVFFNPKNEFLEPLCAIYEPKFYRLGLEAMANDLKCPRRILGQVPIQKLSPPFPDQLDNANTPEDFKRIKTKVEL